MHAGIPELGSAELRQFGITTGLIIGGLFGLLLPVVFGHAYPVWPWIITAALVAWALVAPTSLRPVYRGWMRFGLAISKVTTPLLLGAVYFLIVFPMGVVRRILGKDSMARKFDSDARTYRIATRKAPSENLENPY